MIGAKIRAEVRSRANNTCEYCHLHQDDSPLASLHLEHIIPKIHGGSDDLDNRALACIDCNLHKGPNLTGIDPETNQLTALYHPRQQQWKAHFEWSGIHLVGRTATGRTTIRVLNMNSEDQLSLRSS
jgi:5-methylcytosine-specific restriction endonuclease McrA